MRWSEIVTEIVVVFHLQDHTYILFGVFDSRFDFGEQRLDDAQLVACRRQSGVTLRIEESTIQPRLDVWGSEKLLGWPC